MPELELAPVETQTKPPATGRYFTRFTREQRYLHAVLFSTFLGLAGTELPLRFSESIWARGLARRGRWLRRHPLLSQVLRAGALRSLS